MTPLPEIPVRIVARLASPVVMEGQPPHLPLDGLLHRAWLRQREGAEFYSHAGQGATPTGAPDTRPPLRVELPLARILSPTATRPPTRDVWQPRPAWYYAASGAQFTPDAVSTEYWNKRPDLRQFRERTGLKRLDIGSGPFKAYHMPLFVTHVRTLVWHARCTDLEALRALLWYVQTDGVGKKTGIGYGRVTRINVETVAGDESVWGTDGTLRRAIPASDALAFPVAAPYALRDMPLTPPYFERSPIRCATQGRRQV